MQQKQAEIAKRGSASSQPIRRLDSILKKFSLPALNRIQKECLKHVVRDKDIFISSKTGIMTFYAHCFCDQALANQPRIKTKTLYYVTLPVIGCYF